MSRVIVVGAGLAGLASACRLVGDGHEVTLIERAEPAPWSADAPDLRVYAFALDNRFLLDEDEEELQQQGGGRPPHPDAAGLPPATPSLASQR